MQKGFAHIFALVGVLILILVAGEVFYFSKVKVAQTVQTAVNTPVVSNQNDLFQIPKISIAQQPQFSEYTNKDFGIAFSYAKELNVKADSEEEYNKRGNGDFRKNFTGYVGYEPRIVLGAVAVLDKNGQYDTNPFSVWIFDNPDNLTIDGWFNKYWYYPFVWGVFDWTSKGHIALDSEATISGQTAKYKVVSYQPGKPKFIYVANNGNMYLLRIIDSAGEQILSTFKFLQ